MIQVDFEEVVSEAILSIGADGSDEVAKQFARTWLWRGLQKLGSTDDELEVCTITAKNLLLKKPKNMKQLDEIALFDAAGNYIPHRFHSGNKRIYPSTEQYTYTENEGTDEEVVYYLPVDLSENRSSFVIGTNGTMVAEAMVRYWAYPLDANNLPIIREDEVEALVAYVRYKWSQRKNENQSEIRENRVVWMQEADQCKAAKKASDFSNEKRKAIAATMSRMIPNFNRSQF